MKKFLPLVLVLVLLPLSPQAQQQESSKPIEEVVVTASPLEKTREGLAGSINILSGDALQREVEATLGETLQSQLGVVASSFGPGVGIPVIRGLRGSRVLALSNNHNIGDASISSLDHAIGSEVFLADRIEVLRGPATLRFGGGAIGGVVNVIDDHGSDDIEGYGSETFLRNHINNDEDVFGWKDNGRWGGVSLNFDIVTRSAGNIEIPGLANPSVDDLDETTNGYIGNTSREADAINFGMKWHNDNFVAGFKIGLLDNKYGLPQGTHAHHHEEEGEDGHDDEEEHHEESADVNIELDQTTYQGDLEWQNLPGAWQNLTVDLSVVDYEHTEFETEDGTTTAGTRYAVENFEVRSEATYQADSLGGALGVQISDRDFVAVGEEAFVPASETSQFGVFKTVELEFDRGVLDAGARFDSQSVKHTSGSIDHDTFNLSGSWLHFLNEQNNLGVILSLTERAPTAEELLTEGEHLVTNAFEVGDASLNSEESTSIEIGWRHNGRVSASVSFYSYAFDNFIYLHDTGLLHNHDLESLVGLATCSMAADFDDAEEAEEALPCFSWRQQSADFTGIEAEVGFELAAGQSLRLWSDSVRAEFGDGTDVPRIPPQRIGIDYTYSNGPWFVEVSALNASAQNRPGVNQARTAGYTKLDAYGSYTAERWSVFVKATNITDEEIRNATSFVRNVAPEPGRNIAIGGKFEF